MKIQQLAKEQEQYVLDCRHYLHQHAELSCQETETTAFIVEELTKMGIEVQTFDDITGCVGTIRGKGPGKTLMLRADIDALPIQEPAGAGCSLHDGVMHACGHDCHTAMLLGAAKILQEHRDEFNGTVKLIFQMGEEIGRKSEEYVKRGALEGVDAIFAMHIWPSMDTGFCNFTDGPRMACSDRYTIQIHGTASHGSAPHLGHDAVLAAAASVMALQSIASRQVNPLDSVVVSTGIMNGGTKQNILCDHVELVGTVRSFDRDFRNSMPERIANIVENTCAAYGCTADCDYYFGPSPLINDQPELVRIAQEAARAQMGEDCLRPLPKMMGAEDFSVYTEHIPGMYGYLGIRNRDKGIDCNNHHPGFKADEDALWNGTGIFVEFATRFLGE